MKKFLIVVIFILLIIVLDIGYDFYLSKNNGYLKQQALGPSQFTELLEMAKESHPHPDPYISSEIKPKDPLYPGIIAIQIGLPAADLLRPMAEQENADAMFWLAGRVTGLEAIYGGEAALYRQAAELGNPYAAMKLDPRLNPSYECDPKLELTHFRCDEKWGEIAHELLKSRAESGDIKAEYYYHRSRMWLDGSWSTKNDYLTIIDIATRGAKEHYYRPLYDLIQDYYISLPPDRNMTKDNLEAIKQLLKLMINNNYVLATGLSSNPIFYDSFSNEWKETITEKYSKLGLRSKIALRFFYAMESKEKTMDDKLLIIYKNVYILKHVFNEDDYFMIDEEYHLSEDDPIRLAAEEEARAFIKTMHFPIYIDEQNPSY